MRDKQIKLNEKSLRFGLMDVDQLIIQFIKDNILPTISIYDTLTDIPFLPASAEDWFNAQKFYIVRDQKGQIQCPIMIYKRQDVKRNQNIPIPVLNPFNPMLTYRVKTKQIPKGKYQQSPIYRYTDVVIPQFITVTYGIKAWTNYMQHANIIIQNFNYFSRNYWGNNNVRFYTVVDSFSTDVQLSQSTERMILTDIKIQVNAYIIPNIKNLKMAKQSQSINKIKLQQSTNQNIYIEEDIIKRSTQQMYRYKKR